LIVGLLKGLRVVGKEIMVLAGGFYGLKDGVRRVLLDVDGFSHLRIDMRVPDMQSGGAKVPAVVTYCLGGKPQEPLEFLLKVVDGIEDDQRIPVRLNAGMGVDAVLGKAESKILRRLYQIVTGIDVPDDDYVGDDNTIDATSAPSAAPVPVADLMDEFRAGIAAAEKPGQARNLYDAWFGPDSTRDYTPEQHELAVKLTGERETELWQQSQTNRQQQLAGMNA